MKDTLLNRVLHYIVLSLLFMGVAYLFGSFCALSFNVTYWEEGLRLMVGILMICAIAVGGIVTDNMFDYRYKKD